MYKFLLLILSTLLFSSFACADTCPSVDDIKHQRFNGWVAFDSEDNKPLSNERLAQLAKYIHQFALAEFTKKGPNGPAMHCYYRDLHGSDMEAYFSKDNLNPINTQQAWYEVTGYMHCAAGMNSCTFQNTLPTNNVSKLAKK